MYYRLKSAKVSRLLKRDFPDAKLAAGWRSPVDAVRDDVHIIENQERQIRKILIRNSHRLLQQRETFFRVENPQIVFRDAVHIGIAVEGIIAFPIALAVIARVQIKGEKFACIAAAATVSLNATGESAFDQFLIEL